MKRKLPQWLLDATNNSDQSPKANSPQQRSPTNSNEIQPEHSNPKNAESDQIRSNGAINVVPLANLLLPSRGGVQIDVTSSSIHTTDNMEIDGGIRTTRSVSVENPVATSLPVVIKTEPMEPSTSNTSNEQPQVTVKQEIKDEPVENVTVTATPPTLVPKIESAKPERRACNYGIKCFRRNAVHRSEMAHPGDADYRRPDLPNAPVGTPPCPWGAACYRRNPQHFLQLSHPPATSTTTVVVNAVPQSNPPRRRSRNNRVVAVNGSDDSDAEEDYDLLDPFIDDGSSDEYLPDEDGNDDDDDDDDDTQILTDN